ncbi:hypothetical protein [Singulisphaera acidiphila]|uniref:Uncharacterized protein n=1 Tax=Singulisphaera acidiphila (strain ATCC BAA-1392 / DSM 18658 / VKM B-2454 / MOB10) TaxID=886293 RepID=L0DAQ2_SINAD|nr:hypothetical protein [Singulisphaera acidiphila]AGA25903.1 hypothetical protein Sinac_1524 [Singulisphaera acidiphila DSM 18658]
MRLWHLTLAIVLIALVLTVAQDAVGMVAIVVFITGLGEAVVGTTAIIALFQTLGSLGEAKGLSAHAEAVVATTVVLAVSTAIMTGWLFIGAWIVQAVVA